MKTYLHILVLLIVPFVLSAKGKLAEHLPDNAWMAMEFENLSKLQKNLKEGPFGNIWEHPGIKKLRDQLPKAFPDNAENGPSKELFERMMEFGEQFSGQVAFSIAGIEKMLEVDENDKHAWPSIVVPRLK